METSDEPLKSPSSPPSSKTAGADPVGRSKVPAQSRRVEINPARLPEAVQDALDKIIGGAPKNAEGTEYGWASAGSRIGTVPPAPPGEERAADFHIGEGIQTRGNTLVAALDGVLQIDEKGVNLHPAALPSWSTSGGPEEGCFLTYTPGHPALAPPQVQNIMHSAGRFGMGPDTLLPEEEIQALLSGAAEGKSLHAVISLHADGYAGMEIDSRRLRADIRIRKSAGKGKPVTLKQISEVIQGSGLSGLDTSALKNAIMAFWKGKETSTVLTVKEGKVPERGPDRRLEYLLPFLEEQDAASIRRCLKDRPETTMGLASLKTFPPASIVHFARVEEKQAVGRLEAAKTGQSGQNIDGENLPGLPGNDPSIHIHENLIWEDAQIIAQIEGMLDIGVDRDGATHLRVRPHKDALIRITVSDDKTKAFVSTRLPVGSGEAVSESRILQEAEEAGVVKGFLEEALNTVCEQSLDGEIVTEYLIAEGRLPMQGGAKLSLAVNGDPATAPVSVKAGDVIGTIQNNQEGGWNVLGEPILSEGGSITEGENIERRNSGAAKSKLVALKGGHLMMGEGQIWVKHALDYVGDVSMASGNIRFPGRIKIDGSVLSRVVVDGGEGVEITQVMQAALVNSDADVRIGRGIKGEGKAVVRTQGKLTLGYAEEANLLSTGDIIVDKALMNCRVKCNGRLKFSPKGKLIGGVLKLKYGMMCQEAGNERGAETAVSFGQDYLVENQIDQVQNEISKIQEYINKIDAMMADLERKNAADKLIVVRRKKVDALKMLEKKNLRIFLLREKFEQHFQSEIRIAGTAFPGLTIESHGRVFTVSEPMKSFRVVFNPEVGKIERKPL